MSLIRAQKPVNKRFVAVIITLHACIVLISSCLQSPTRNEVAHVPAGLDCLVSCDFRLYCVNPPLAKMIATLPILALGPKTDSILSPKVPGIRSEWVVARTFAADNASNYFALIWSARLAGIGCSLLAGWIVYRWATNLYGGRAGLVSLVLWCFGPNVLAHAPLATPDVPATVAGLAASYSFWRYLRTGDWRLAIVSGVALGLAQLTKFTLVILYVVWPIMWFLHWADPSNTLFRSAPLKKRLLFAAAILTLSILTINLGYEFNGSFRILGDYQFVSRELAGERAASVAGDGRYVGNRFSGTWLGRVPVPLPADYLIGIDLQQADFEGRFRSYLAGEWRDRGWWYYYLYGLAVKVPLSTWALVLWGMGLTLFRHPSSARPAEELSLWLPALAVLALVSSQTGFNHHLRYVLPMAPFVMIVTGKLGYFLQPGRWRTGVIVLVLLGASVASSLRVYPHSLSYFNELAGGPNYGHKHLVNSNIDWGQDLFFFQRWVDRHPEARQIGLAYFNFIDYRVFGKEYGHVPPDPSGMGLDPMAAAQFGPHPGWFGVDVYGLTEGQYKYFERFTPVAKAGYSIFIYHITLEEANRARAEMGLPALPEP